MKYTATLTINVHFDAPDTDAANLIAQEMEYDFTHPTTGEKMNQDLIDWEIKEGRE
jgi:hypothetical protein